VVLRSYYAEIRQLTSIVEIWHTACRPDLILVRASHRRSAEKLLTAAAMLGAELISLPGRSKKAAFGGGLASVICICRAACVAVSIALRRRDNRKLWD